MNHNHEADAGRNKKANIMLTAARLFIEQGYEKTGMRQIAEEAGVSLSLINYHFGSKKELGVRLIRAHIRAQEPYVRECVGAQGDKRLVASTWMRLNYTLMVQPKFYQFYVDTLLNDIYLEALNYASVAYEQQCSLSLSEMYWVLADSYIPVSIERAMVLCPFTPLLDQYVPDIIIKYFLYDLSVHGEHGGAMRDSDWYVAKSREAVGDILARHPHLYDMFLRIPGVVVENI